MVLELLKHRLIDHLTPETLADELYFHRYREGTINGLMNGIPLISIKRRGTVHKGAIDPPNSGHFLVFRVSRQEQSKIFELALSLPYENWGYHGFALKTPLPPQYYAEALEWYQIMKRTNSYYEEFPDAIPLEDFRYLPVQYLIGAVEILGRYKFSGRHSHITDYTFPYCVSLLPEIPNYHTLSPILILEAMKYYRRVNNI